MISILHTACGVFALITGAWNLLLKKGTSLHRRVGWVYAGSMGVLIVTSFFIYDLFGGFGVFHALAIVSGATLALALYFPLRRERHPGWLYHHYFWMAYSYIGLVMATGSHFMNLVPDWPFWLRGAVFWGLPYVLGSIWVFRGKERILSPLVRQYADAPAG